MRIATLAAPLEPVTSASPFVTATASTLPAENASIDGAYSNHLSSTSTPSSLNQPFCTAMSHATQPGQSLYAMVSGGPAFFAGSAAVAATGVAGAIAAADGAGAVCSAAGALLQPDKPS